MLARLPGLWQHPNFLKFWTGQTISQFGTQITVLALPLTAALFLQATPAQMSILIAAESVPLLLSLFVGVWIDRVQRRPLLLIADALRAVLLMIIPLALWMQLLRIELVYLIAFLVGLLSVLFDVAYQAFLPTLVSHSALVEGNSKLESSRAAAQIAGPGIAGVLVQVLTAPVALLIDALSFIVSALSLAWVRVNEPPIVQQPLKHRMWRDIGEGLGIVWKQPIIRPLVACAATSNFASGMMEAVYILYLTRTLGLTAGLLGTVYASGNIGFLLGALSASRVVRRFGLGSSLVAVTILDGLGMLCVPLVTDSSSFGLAVLVIGRFLIGFAGTIYTINHVSLRQAITPDHLQGRMNASVRFLAGGVVPIGALLGGLIGTVGGLQVTTLVAASVALVAVIWLWRSPVWTLRAFPMNESASSQPLS